MQIVSLLKQNLQDGLIEMMNKYYGLVKTITFRLLNDFPQDAEECVADSFIKVWNTADKIDLERGCLKGYIVCITRATAINRFKQLTRKKLISIYDIEIAQDKDFVFELLSKEHQAMVQMIIVEMQQPDKDILLRRFYLQEPVREIAKQMNLTAKQVENKLYQSKLKLKNKFLMEEEYEQI